MSKSMLIDAAHSEETRVVVVGPNGLEEFDFESASLRTLKGNIYLAKVTRVEPSLQAAFVTYGGNRHGFLPFNEIHPDYYRIPVADREALAAAAAAERDVDDDDDETEVRGATSDDDADDADADEDNDVEASLDDEDGDDSDDEASDDDDTDDETPDGDGRAQALAQKTPDDAVEAVDVETAEAETAEAETAEAETVEAETESATDVVGEAVASAPEAAIEEAAPTETVEARAPDAEEDEAEAGDDAETVDAEASDDAESDDDGEDESDDDDREAASERPRRRRQQRRAPQPKRRNYKIQEVIKRGQILLVQVSKEERGGKGAAMTTYLSLAGRYCVLMPNTGKGGGISRKITDAKDRKRLKEMIQDLDLPDGMAVIVRTAGVQRTKAEIKRDHEFLLRLWEEIRDKTLESTAPALIYEEASLVKRAIRDLYSRDIDQVLVEGDGAYREAKNFMRSLMPSHAKRVQPYKETTPLFTAYGVENRLESLFDPIVRLPSGGYLVVNQTEALVAIDVNSGRSTRERNIEETALKTNLEAAVEAARQLRLRELAGIVVIDFIDMDERRNNQAVERKLKDALKTDRARVHVGRMSPLGLVEMSRQRLRPSMFETSFHECELCGGLGRVRSIESNALGLLRAAEDRAMEAGAGADIVITAVSDAIVYLLNHKRDAVARIEESYGVRIMFNRDDNMASHERRAEIISRGEGDAAGDGGRESRRPEQRESRPERDGDGGRRGRRRGRGRDDGEGRADGPDTSGDDGEDEGGRRGRRRGRGRGEAAEDRADAPDQAGAGDESEDENGRRRRRGRRGGRRRGRGEDVAEAAETNEAADASAESGASDAGDESEAEGDERGGRRRRRRRRGRRSGGDEPSAVETTQDQGDAQTDAVAADAAAEADEAVVAETETAETETAQAEVAETVAVETVEAEPEAAVAEAVEATPADKPAEPEAAAAPEPEAEAAPDPEPEPEPEPVAAAEPELDPNRPRRSGWWSRVRS